jgi:hypothetical protein
VISLSDYFVKAKSKMEKVIPLADSKQFRKMRDRIRNELANKENEFTLLRRSLKIVVLGDWHTSRQKAIMDEIKDTLLKHGIYAQTIDDYYDMNRRGGLSQIQILETCCMSHQLIVFLDGYGSGTITEQSYLSENYVFQRKVLFFIEEKKFNKLKDDPSEYVKMFPAIITHSPANLCERVLVFSRFRMHRLAEIIIRQAATGRGLRNPSYESWRVRLGKLRQR